MPPQKFSMHLLLLMFLQSKMVKFINHLTGTEMFVADDRADEYIRAGFKPASDTSNGQQTGKPEKKPKKGTKK